MKKGNFKKFVSAGVSALMVAASIPSVPGAVVQAADQQQRGNIGGYDYEMWNQNYTGNVSMQPGAGSFTCSWSGIENFLARMGKNYDSKKQNYKSIGKDITLTYDVEYKPQGNSYMCVYGWTRNPLMEYYIVEGWGDWRPPGDQAERKGTVTLDGNTYDIAKTMRYNQPSLDGTQTFPQYWSIRQSSGSRNNTTNYMKGTIHVGNHFDAWARAGLDMSGTLYEVSLNIEGYRSSGSANVKSVRVYENGIDGGEDPIETPTVEPDSNGNYFTSTFESGDNDWAARGDASVTVDSSNYYDGKKSLYVSDRSQEWNGAAIKLDSNAFVPGQTYSFSTGVLQKSGKTVTMQLSLQQGDGDSAQYTSIATADAKSGEWTKLENTKFTIPSGSGDLLLYVETPQDSGDLCDFYIDAVQASKSGKSSSVVTGQGTVAGGGSSSDTPSDGDDTPQVTPPPTDTGLASHQNMDYTYKKGGDGFKDHAGPLFRLGTSVSASEINTSQGQNFIKQNYNSITCENEMKPSEIVTGVNGDNVQISLYKADPILKFAEQNGIGVRGHTFVWYSQTPNSIFQENGRDVSKDRMNKRLESMIKNTFDAIKKNYPNLKLHSYDVCNELFVNDGGGMRPGSNSGWTRVYGDGNSEFVINAFKYARQYAPSTTKLYLNDYNEYISAKTNDLYNMAKKVMAEGNYIDGIGMQSHLDSRYPSASEYETALKKFESLGLDVQVTELDITNSTGTNNKLYPQIFEVIAKHAKNISCVTLWGTTDERSWRYRENGGSPLPFSNYQPKAFYSEIISILDKYAKDMDVTTTTTTKTTTTTTTTATTTTTVDPKAAFEAKVSLWGDANLDNTVDMSDIVLIMQSLANPSKYTLSEKAAANADVYQAGSGVTNNDAQTLQKYLLGLVKNLPESWASSISVTPAKTTTTTKKSEVATTTTTKQVVSNKTYINNTFDSGVQSWSGRGDASVEVSSDSYYDGKSLFVSGRSQEWNGAAISLGSDFVAGQTYSISAAVLQQSGNAATLQISLQQGEGDSASYTTIASETCKSGEWTKLENTSFTIPENSGDMTLYIETVQDSGDLMDFYVDNVLVASEGTKSSVVTGGGKVGEVKAPVKPTINGKKLCAISFDDGAVGNASSDTSMRILNALIKNGMTATFFYVGDWTTTSGDYEEVKYAYKNGMEVANHSKSHPSLGSLGSQQVRSEWEQCNSKLKSIIGAEPSQLLRLPYLDGGGSVKSALYDVPLISCAIDTKDWDNASKDQIVNTIKQAAQNGSLEGAIVLCHETYGTTAGAMEEVLPWLAQNGYMNVNISDLAAAKGKTLAGGQIHTRV